MTMTKIEDWLFITPTTAEVSSDRTPPKVFNERHNDWDVHRPHVESVYKTSVSAATGLVPDEVHMTRLPRLPLTVFGVRNIGGHQSLNRDQPAKYDLARN